MRIYYEDRTNSNFSGLYGWVKVAGESEPMLKFTQSPIGSMYRKVTFPVADFLKGSISDILYSETKLQVASRELGKEFVEYMKTKYYDWIRGEEQKYADTPRDPECDDEYWSIHDL